MVEHDLAKVGAASSTLVSRSIISFFLLSLTLFAQPPFTLQDSYLFKQHDIYSTDLFETLPHRFKILEIPKNRQQYKVRAEEIIGEFEKLGMVVLPNKTHIITFQKAYDFDYKHVLEFIREKFSTYYAPYAFIIKDIQIKALSFANLEGYKIDKIEFHDRLLKRNSGNFTLIFSKDKKDKKLYFRFDLDATLEVYKAKERMYNKEAFTFDRVYRERIPFTQLSQLPADERMFKGFATSKYLPKGGIITQKHLKPIPTVKKKNILIAFIQQGSLRLETEVTALEDGFTGDIIKVKNADGRVLHAKVIGTGKVEIQ